MPKSNDFNKLVNASGFAFQLGIEHIVKQKRGHLWSVVSSEHPWLLGESEGFIDLVLNLNLVTGVVECKRTRGGTWVFLVPAGKNTKRLISRVLWVAGTEDGRALSGCDPIEHLPKSYISSFCTVRGSGENDRPLLERICSGVLMSTDALAEEEVAILRRKNQVQGWQGFYLPIIVTTAELQVCHLDPGDVDLFTGTIPNGEFEPVDFIRFQKAFSGSGRILGNPKDLSDAARLRERTVWIVRAQHFEEFLSGIQEPRYKEKYPWEMALEMARAKGKSK